MKKPSKILLISLGLFLIAVAGSVVAQDEIPPFVSVIAEPSEATSTWQNTQASTYVSCIDEVGGSGCDNESYRLKIYDTDPETCPDIYQDYTFCNGLSCTLSNSQTIFSHQWVCAAATDLALNIGFSEPVEFKIDTTFPIGTISASPVEIRADEIFNIKVTGEDNIDMGTVCYKEEDDIDWTCHTCAGSSTSCSHTFPRSESDLGKYIYYGYVADFVENGSFTDPTYVLVIVETDPSVSTISAINIEDTQATLEGDLTYMGGAEVVEVWFEYGLTPDYGSETEHILRNNTGTFDIAVTDLFPGTEYHFRAVAKNGVGIAYGDDLEFTTFIELINNGGFESGDLTGWEEAGWGGER
ncbi:fibronectin type III domain-containing protein, partial [Patescibacteria group bacterium]|nr:fibronectin type III domain-containing protein [Patescibacteria group bacterium]